VAKTLAVGCIAARGRIFQPWNILTLAQSFFSFLLPQGPLLVLLLAGAVHPAACWDCTPQAAASRTANLSDTYDLGLYIINCSMLGLYTTRLLLARTVHHVLLLAGVCTPRAAALGLYIMDCCMLALYTINYCILGLYTSNYSWFLRADIVVIERKKE